jgi:hypothetical protein
MTQFDNIPKRISLLPRDRRGYPIPWFVFIDEEGEPHFHIADGPKRAQAVKERLCWVCGQRLGRYLAFVIGPMCSINRVSAEPPMHRECAEFSIRACPFLLNPNMKRMPEEKGYQTDNPGGIMIARNPGVMALWMATDFRVVKDHQGGWLFRVGDPLECLWYAQGRQATRAEVMDSMESGLPILVQMANDEGGEATQALHAAYELALKLVPAA